MSFRIILLVTTWLFLYEVRDCFVDINTATLFGVTIPETDSAATGGTLGAFYDTLDSFSSDSAAKNTICGGCAKVLDMVKFFHGIGTSKDVIANMVSSMCTTFAFYDGPTCQGTVDVFKDSVFYILERTKLSSTQICGVVFGATCANLDDAYFNWTIALPTKPTISVNPVAKLQTNKPAYRILHLTDIHHDPTYTEGSSSHCNRPMCCQPNDFPVTDEKFKAGKWGSYENCDIPMITIESMLNHITSNHSIDLVYWTGDIVPHNHQVADKDKHINIIRNIGSLLKQKFGNIPVYASVGNHEALPMYSFPSLVVSEEFSISWLYETLSEVYGAWLPNDTIPTIRKGAYYSVRLENNLKIISVNTNYCGNLNFWLLLNNTDPAEQLSWLVNELYQSELVGEKVHILSHFPPGKFDCLKVWSDNYYRIINRFYEQASLPIVYSVVRDRESVCYYSFTFLHGFYLDEFESTVVGQFFGHTHFDEFELFYNENLTRATNIAYVAPSVTSYVDVNPSYRIYIVDGSSWAILDHETYFMNLSEANANPNREPIWSLSYSAKEYYGLKDLQPEEWNRLVNTFETDDDMFQKFYRVYKTRSDSNFKVCQGQCKVSIICGLRTGHSNDPTFCERLRGM